MAPSDNAHPERTYWCFISYRHADNKESGRQWASWLHQAIETYEVPDDLVGTVNSRGDEIPERIFPVFRDEEELPADADLSRPIEAALRNSKTLVVLCSPRAVQSQYVAQEIHEFKKLGHSDRIMAALLDGEPNSSRDESKDTEECFPKPLMHPIGGDGELLTDEWAEPIAADFRLSDGSEGWTSPTAYRQDLESNGELSSAKIDHAIETYRKSLDLAKLKIIAGIIGVPLGTLTQRDKAYQLAKEQRKARVFRAVASGMTLLAVLAIIAGIFAFLKKQEAIRERTEAERQKVEAENARDDAESLIRFLTQDFAQDINGYLPIAKRREVSKRIAAYLARQQEGDEIEPSEQNWAFTHRLAQILQEEQKTDAARQKYQEAVEIAEALKGSPDLDRPWQDMAGESSAEWAMLELNDNHTERVGDLGRKTLELYEELLSEDPDNVKARQGKANGLTLIADGFLNEGKFAEAREYCEAQYQIRLKLHREDPLDQLRTKRMAVAHERMGQLQSWEQKLDAAETSYRNSARYAKLASSREPGNMLWKNDVGLVLFHLAAIHAAKEDFEKSLEKNLESAAIFEALIEWDPDKLVWRKCKLNGQLGALYVFTRPAYKGREEGFEYAKQATASLADIIQMTDINTDTTNLLISLENSRFDLFQLNERTTEPVDQMVRSFEQIEEELSAEDYSEVILVNLSWLAIRIEIAQSYFDPPRLKEKKKWLDRADALAKRCAALNPNYPGLKPLQDFIASEFKSLKQ